MAKPKVYSGFTSTTAEKLLLDAGAFFKNFTVGTDTFDAAVTAGKLIGATSGGGTFTAVPSVRAIEIDGIKGAAKGMQVIDDWEVSLMANVKEVSTASLQNALGAATTAELAGTDYYMIEGNNYFEATDYIDNIVWVGKLSGSQLPVIIEVKNALSLGGLSINMEDKSEGLIATTFTGHFAATDTSTPPFAIYYPKAINNTLTQDATTFSKAAAADIKFTVVSSGAAVPVDIKLNNVVLASTNRTILATVFTLKKEYISTLANGKYQFMIVTDIGNDILSAEITITD